MGLKLHRLNYGQILLDEDFQLVGFNPFIEARTGAIAKDSHGRSIFDVFPELDAGRLSGMMSKLREAESGHVIDAEDRTLLWPGLFEDEASKSEGCQLVILNRVYDPSVASCYSLMIFHREVLDQLYDQSLVN